MDPILAWIEGSALSTLVRETPSIFAFPAVLVLHSIGMGLLAGGSATIDLRILGFAPGVPLAPMGKFFPLLWLAMGANVITGALLLIAYPTKALTNPVFYVKLACIALALIVLRKIGIEVFGGPHLDQGRRHAKARILACVSLFLWAATITAGRFLAYTHSWEMLGIRAIS
jgi:hypothetical protein